MKTTLILITLAALMTTSAVANESAQELEGLMGSERYKAAGLDELSENQRGVLAAWLKAQLGEPREAPVEVAKAPAENWGVRKPPRNQNKPAEPEKLHAQIVGPFRGWSGKTRFQLDNGQVWVQRRSGHFNYTGDVREVVISKNGLGFFEMTLVGLNRRVGVKRIK